MKNNKRLSFPIPLFLWCSLFAGVTLAQQDSSSDSSGNGDGDTAPETVSALEFTRKGADTCIKCHDEESEFPVFDIFKTRHAMKADSRTPFAGLQCEACHGPGEGGELFSDQNKRTGDHTGRVRRGQERPSIINFGAKSKESVAVQNRICQQCHKGDSHIAWPGSAHDMGEVSCASCHKVHAAHDPVLDTATQPDVCFQCHLKERAEFFKPNSHPVRADQMACSDCHTTHGSSASTLLSRPTLNETCFTCHAEKRGPFLWEHAPVSEDCSLCHTPHGSVHPALLTKRPPLLCQQCHSQLGHPSVALTPTGLPSGSPSGFLLAGSCTNCHSQVHGSNHPSGVKLMR